MKVLLVNGSPKKDGNTATALAEVARELDACGIESEVFQLGAGPIRDCIGCGGCAGKGRCVFGDDVVNDLIEAAEVPTASSSARRSTTRTPPGASFLPSTARSTPAAPPSPTSRARRSRSRAAAARAPRSTCSISTSPSTRCPSCPRRTGTTPSAPPLASRRRTPRAWPPCATSRATWPGCSAASRRAAPRASRPPRPTARRRTSSANRTRARDAAAPRAL